MPVLIRRLFSSYISLLFTLSSFSLAETTTLNNSTNLPLVPYPAEIIYANELLNLPNELTVSGDISADSLDHLNQYYQLNFTQASRPDSFISLLKPHKPQPSNEAYRLLINEKGIQIKAGTQAGHFRGLQTLCQIIKNQQPRSKSIPCLKINDAPRFHWRGFMLDVSRHFSEIDEIKALLDEMSDGKMNIFHWHLTDSNGWRLEIKKYPKLTSIGAQGDKTKPKGPIKFYTQDQVREVVAYAKARHITVIPEIDMPGHANAAVRAFPELTGGNSKRNGAFTFNPASESVEHFLVDVLKEVATLFPDAPVIHFGGDESHFGWDKWETLPEVKTLIKKENYNNLHQVEHAFNRRMANHINDLGKQVGGWDEVVNAKLTPKKTTIFWWRHNKPEALKASLSKGFPTVLCPRIPCYFDFVQDSSHKSGRRWNGFVSIDKTYAFPDSSYFKDQQLSKHIQGVQACLWTETTVTKERRQFMTYPRLYAIAAAGWTEDKNKDFDRFMRFVDSKVLELKASNGSPYDRASSDPEIKK